MASLFRASAPVLAALAALAALESAAPFAADRDDTPPDALIGYTEFRTDLPGGRYVNVAMMRAVVVKADGTGRRVLAEALTREAGSWTQFVGWSPDGKAARLSRYWKSEEVGKWEEEHKTFRPVGEGFRHDAWLSASNRGPHRRAIRAHLSSWVHYQQAAVDDRFCSLLLSVFDPLVTLPSPGETESGSAGTQPDEG